MADKEYIERGALLKQFEKNEPHNWAKSDSEIQEEIDYACYRGLVETAPTADVVEVRHGSWIKTTRAAKAPNGLFCWGAVETVFVCSECGRTEDKEEPYCNCGAKMDGWRDDE